MRNLRCCDVALTFISAQCTWPVLVFSLCTAASHSECMLCTTNACTHNMIAHTVASTGYHNAHALFMYSCNALHLRHISYGSPRVVKQYAAICSMQYYSMTEHKRCFIPHCLFSSIAQSIVCEQRPSILVCDTYSVFCRVYCCNILAIKVQLKISATYQENINMHCLTILICLQRLSKDKRYHYSMPNAALSKVRQTAYKTVQ
jgi:hypothetical protein